MVVAMSDATPEPITADDKDWTWVLERPCPECGFEARDHRKEQLGAEIRANAAQWRTLLADADVATRPEPTIWSALEYGCHVRDVFELFYERLNLMLGEDDPTFANWDQDATAVEQNYGTQDPAKVAYGLAVGGGRLADAFDRVTPTQWQRTGRRSDGASFTIESFGRYLLHDPVHHVWDVERGNEALAER